MNVQKQNDRDVPMKSQAPTGRRAWWIGAGAAVVCALGLAVVACAPAPRNRVAPEDAAKAWATKLQLPYRGAACTMFDSDDDGYVSCIVALDGPDRVYFQGLQCGELGSSKGGGCKVDAKNPETKLVVAINPDGRVTKAPP